MRPLGLALLCCAVLFSPFSLAVDVSKVYGRIQIVDSFPDYRVQIVNAHEHLRVEEVTAFANRAGQWKIVDNFPDFKIQIVDAHPDFKIRLVDNFPGPSRR
ncbi:putative exported protein [Pectobacterium atrosepticum SCRI1043]|uniref:Exported protein n=1 Tax=Pectobacterium atrosepticum (strain SCRI 1043 / ATCC BAA-672) TaxID=218491 RepID=Q6D2L0_PECAS|nr:hypothetical protein [Pectobacterium atrosepticum]GKV84424.1 hypothetical protein PEC301296_07360 [Pectobacterium carotovorum subsp. carotovorum]AIA71909.1 hypothetical protein EV46_15265 [Pectobacterium atrosepticum]AIK14872.1 putative exported protein [Pectobacterium atrosepticum]ATY91612.1 hypothetical protein CVS35_15225 [Pectobacterium atrosepticum]KFX14987.1 hypothetical protein JV34_09540 [Pectobacterium atrosepticum]